MCKVARTDWLPLLVKSSSRRWVGRRHSSNGFCMRRFVMVLSVLRRYVWFPPKPEAAAAGEPAEASVAAAAIKPDRKPASNGSSGTDADDEEDEDAIVVRRRRVRRDT